MPSSHQHRPVHDRARRGPPVVGCRKRPHSKRVRSTAAASPARTPGLGDGVTRPDRFATTTYNCLPVVAMGAPSPPPPHTKQHHRGMYLPTPRSLADARTAALTALALIFPTLAGRGYTVFSTDPHIVYEPAGSWNLLGEPGSTGCGSQFLLGARDNASVSFTFPLVGLPALGRRAGAGLRRRHQLPVHLLLQRLHERDRAPTVTSHARLALLRRAHHNHHECRGPLREQVRPAHRGPLRPRREQPRRRRTHLPGRYGALDRPSELLVPRAARAGRPPAASQRPPRRGRAGRVGRQRLLRHDGVRGAQCVFTRAGVQEPQQDGYRGVRGWRGREYVRLVEGERQPRLWRPYHPRDNVWCCRPSARYPVGRRQFRHRQVVLCPVREQRHLPELYREHVSAGDHQEPRDRLLPAGWDRGRPGRGNLAGGDRRAGREQVHWRGGLDPDGSAGDVDEPRQHALGTGVPLGPADRRDRAVHPPGHHLRHGRPWLARPTAQRLAHAHVPPRRARPGYERELPHPLRVNHDVELLRHAGPQLHVQPRGHDER
ncbi:hypothetical protein CALCODRAFT_112758 [Calocera cornea HHB12733]|uniref:Uncharacterized protein n=1 Tax=Calocera cornea HHB12733 TaxID=1353952 RepID=A0A165D175_9BASI|nr:hypothetical protein CALCODRAFT_112758 [Calocera cornea HHB12733]